MMKILAGDSSITIQTLKNRFRGGYQRYNDQEFIVFQKLVIYSL